MVGRTPKPEVALEQATRRSVLLAALVVVQVALAGVELSAGELAGHWAATVRLIVLSFGLLPVILILAYRLWASHRKLRSELATHTESFSAMLSGIDQWAWSIDREGAFIFSNIGIRELLGYEPEELIGRDSISFLVAPGDRETVAEQLAAFREARQGWTGWEMALRHKDGQVRHIEGHGLPILDAAGELIGWSGSVRDRTKEVNDLLDLQQRTQEVLEVVKGSGLEILFQPIVDLRSGEIVGVEALSRIDSDPYRPPNVWFAAAHAVELGTELELLAVRNALAKLNELPPDVYLALNVSPGLLPHAALEGHLLGYDLNRIVIEVTEHESLEPEQYARVKGYIAELQKLGVKVAVDDAGAGFSSLRHILELEPDIVKLDVSITASIERDPARRALAASLAQFARETSIDVVAEGIESVGDARTITAAGINYGQGYGLARPARLPLPTGLLDHLELELVRL